jgi:hypothetical protein
LTEYFPQNHGGRFFTKLLAATHPPRKNTHSAARKIAQIPIAFSLPQDSPVQLMFDAACFGEPALSASRSLGFHIARCGGHSPRCLDNPRKCFNQLRILHQNRGLVSS